MMLTHSEICRAVEDAALKYRIKRAYYFGSYANGTQNDDSDLDVLVDFGTKSVSLFTIGGLASELENRLQHEVDLVLLPLANSTHLKIDKVVKCYGAKG